MYELLTGKKPFVVPNCRDSLTITKEFSNVDWQLSESITPVSANLLSRLLNFAV